MRLGTQYNVATLGAHPRTRRAVLQAHSAIGFVAANSEWQLNYTAVLI